MVASQFQHELQVLESMIKEAAASGRATYQELPDVSDVRVFQTEPAPPSRLRRKGETLDLRHEGHESRTSAQDFAKFVRDAAGLDI